jgi:hypothetical protein
MRSPSSYKSVNSIPIRLTQYMLGYLNDEDFVPVLNISQMHFESRTIKSAAISGTVAIDVSRRSQDNLSVFLSNLLRPLMD